VNIIAVEVSPRSQDGEYHACLESNTGVWGSGNSVEEAVASFIGTYHNALKLSTKDCEDAAKNPQGEMLSAQTNLRKLIELLADRGFELDIKFLPLKIR
jgi:predicted RNase H-like HicB family nuclease